MLNYRVSVDGNYFSANKQVIKAWMTEHYMLHLWQCITMEKFPDYIVLFDKQEDAVAFKLRFGL